MMNQLVVALLLILAWQQVALGDFPIKHLAGTPDTFVTHQIPDPTSTITSERSASLFVWFQAAASPSDIIYTTQIPVDGSQEFAISLASPHADQLVLDLKDPNGVAVPLHPIQSSMVLGETVSVPTTVYIIENSMRGNYLLNIHSPMDAQSILKLAASPYPNAVLTIFNNDLIEIESHYTNYLLKTGQEIGIISSIVDAVTKMTSESILVSSAMLEVITPDGKDLEVQMSDSDSSLAKFNIPPHSSVYGAQFVATVPGQYIVQAYLRGNVVDPVSDVQVPFARSTQHVITVSAATIELTGTASLRKLSDQLLAIDIGVTGSANSMRAYAEVYGTDANNQQVAACWIGGIVQLTQNTVTLQLDTQWLQMAKVNGPLTLKNVYIVDLSTSFPVSIAASSIVVADSEDLVTEITDEEIVITQEMLEGFNPLKKAYDKTKQNETAAATLVLLPGYCSATNPWEGDKASFTNAVYFNSGGGNLANDDFAKKVLTYLDGLKLNSYSLIGHSQGGMISAHIRNYYFTGMDNAQNGRLIQSVGTPWNGCTAAGSLANLGNVFGVGCGSNNDLSLDGAKLWQTGITTQTRQHVHFYTTTYKQGGFLGDYCNLAMNLVLQWPNDGTTEINYASLASATYEGNKEQWCHTTGMAYKPHYLDAARNAQMNSLAAR